MENTKSRRVHATGCAETAGGTSRSAVPNSSCSGRLQCGCQASFGPARDQRHPREAGDQSRPVGDDHHHHGEVAGFYESV